MEYTIETILRVKGGEGSGVSIFKKKGDDLQAVVAAQVRSLCNYYAVPHEALKGIEALGARPKKAKHPLEEVFAEVPGAISHAEARRLMPVGLVDSAFRNCVSNAVTQSAPVKGLPPLHWVKVSVIWAAVRLVKQRRYQTIEDVLAAAVLQATKGKGQRHGGDTTPFLEQPWVKLYRTHGLGFLLGQADKKYHEALGKPDTESFEREILGAIVYLGMALLALEGRV